MSARRIPPGRGEAWKNSKTLKPGRTGPVSGFAYFLTLRGQDDGSEVRCAYSAIIHSYSQDLQR